MQEGKSGRILLRPQQDYPTATVDQFCTAVPTGRRLLEMQHLKGLTEDRIRSRAKRVENFLHYGWQPQKHPISLSLALQMSKSALSEAYGIGMLNSKNDTDGRMQLTLSGFLCIFAIMSRI